MPTLLMRGAFAGARYVASEPEAAEVVWTETRADARRFELPDAVRLQTAIVAREGVAVAAIPESPSDRARAALRAAEAW